MARLLQYFPLLVLYICDTASAQAQSPLIGVWQGTLGITSITACFNPVEYDTQLGNYYYQKHLNPIHLNGSKKAGLFDEPIDAITWQLNATADGSLNGTWTKPSKEKSTANSLAIALKPVNLIKNTGTQDFPCTNDAYLKPLVESLPLKKSEVKTFQGKTYFFIKRELKGVGSVESIQLLGQSKQYQTINHLFKEKTNIDDLHQCMTGSMQRGVTGDWNTSFGKIRVWGKRWFVAESFYDVYCGGAHPNGGIDIITY